MQILEQDFSATIRALETIGKLDVLSRPYILASDNQVASITIGQEVPFITNSRYFKFIEKHHRIHHIHMDRNLNVLLPLADFCLGSLVTEMPTAVPTPEAARRLARRHSEYGKRMQDRAR